MSLINDALKRATAKRNAPTEGGPVLQPVTEDSGKGKKMVLLVLVLLLVGGAGYAGWSWWSGKQSSASGASQPAVTAKSSGSSATNNPVAKAAATFEAAVARGDEKPTDGAAKENTPASAANKSATPSPAPQPPAVELRLQGIFFRSKDPTAIINGKTVRVGDVIEGAKILRIDRASVRVDVSGKQQDLTLK